MHNISLDGKTLAHYLHKYIQQLYMAFIVKTLTSPSAKYKTSF